MLRRPSSHQNRKGSQSASLRVWCFVAFTLCTVGLPSCARETSSIQWTALGGDPAVLSKFRGRWYEVDGFSARLDVEVTGGSEPLLGFRLPPGFVLADARSVGDQIHFWVGQGEAQGEYSLTLLAEDELVWDPAGRESDYRSLCSYRLRRFTGWGGLAVWQAKELGKGVLSATADWLVKVL